MPAAAVIPAPIAYIKVVAVKKLVVGFLVVCCVRPQSLDIASAILLLTYWPSTASRSSDILP